MNPERRNRCAPASVSCGHRAALLRRVLKPCCPRPLPHGRPVVCITVRRQRTGRTLHGTDLDSGGKQPRQPYALGSALLARPTLDSFVISRRPDTRGVAGCCAHFLQADACEPPPKSLRSTVALVALPHKVIGSLTSALAKQVSGRPMSLGRVDSLCARARACVRVGAGCGGVCAEGAHATCRVCTY